MRLKRKSNLAKPSADGLPRLRAAAERLALVKWARSDGEFLPAAISILETPPSPVHIGLLWAICLLLSVVLTWMYFGHIDIIAIAQGKIQPAGRVKTIQPLETGRVVAIHAENGRHVTAGEVLVELDPAEAAADERGSSIVYLAYVAEKVRRKAALNAIANNFYDKEIAVDWPKEIPDQLKEREGRILRGDLRQLLSSLKSIDAQLDQKEEEQRRLKNTIASQESLLVTLKERVLMRKGLLARGSTPRAAVIDSIEALQVQQTNLATQQGQLTEAQAASRVLRQERTKQVDAFVAENEQKLGEAERQIDDFEQRHKKAHEKTEHMTIRSPIAGTVFGLSVTTKNQVLTTGEELMRIVPDDADLEIECYIQNKDIGFVKKDQPAIVKIESFPFTRYGSLDATVTRVAHDAIPEPDAQALEGNPARPAKNSYFGGAQRTQNLVFPVTLRSERSTMNIDGVDVPLSPGMGVTVEIKTGRRRILEYLFSPLLEVASRAMKER
ncbi:HlyD family type I secretion periplasmic adaptor subunit [Methylocystis sp.]|uniref:HlyD family type I secretion periplasmic adaptor subunit n=1 Tax=Methylocystis sp. TaxID=1911079 RepID=UPI003DA55D04